MATFYFCYLNYSISIASKSKYRERQNWKLKVGYNNSHFNISDTYFKILDEYQLATTWEEEEVAEFVNETKPNLFPFDSISSIRAGYVENSLSKLRNCLYHKRSIEESLRVEMRKFEVEIFKRGMSFYQIIKLKEIDKNWARYYHILFYLNYRMYSPNAHAVSIRMQELELNSFEKDSILIEILEEQWGSYRSSRRGKIAAVIEERKKLIIEDRKLYKKIMDNLPQLPLEYKFQKDDLQKIIYRIMEINSPPGLRVKVFEDRSILSEPSLVREYMQFLDDVYILSNVPDKTNAKYQNSEEFFDYEDEYYKEFFDYEDEYYKEFFDFSEYYKDFLDNEDQNSEDTYSERPDSEDTYSERPDSEDTYSERPDSEDTYSERPVDDKDKKSKGDKGKKSKGDKGKKSKGDKGKKSK